MPDLNVEKILQCFKRLPLWVIVGIAVSSGLFWLTPLGLYSPTQEIKDWIPFTTIIFTVLATFLSVSKGVAYYGSKKTLDMSKKTFHVTPIPELCHSSVAKQSDGSVITNLIGSFIIKNCTSAQILLVDASIKSEKRKIMHLISNRAIPAEQTIQVMVSVIINGIYVEKKYFKDKLYIADSHGNKQKVTVNYKSKDNHI